MSEPWLTKLLRGETEAAWDLFVDRYRRLVFATIRRLADDHDDVMDIFARVCEALRQNDLERLRRFTEQAEHRARFSTWLVAVVRNLTIDWFRHRDGRKRLTPHIADLPPLQQKIFQYVFVESRSHLEAYETLRTRDGVDITFGQFLGAVSETYLGLSQQRGGRLLRELAGALPPADAHGATEPDATASDTGEHLKRVMAELATDDRVAVQLFVIDEMPADEVARIVGWPNAKTVYNRVYRTLAAIRKALERPRGPTLARQQAMAGGGSAIQLSRSGKRRRGHAPPVDRRRA